MFVRLETATPGLFLVQDVCPNPSHSTQVVLTYKAQQNMPTRALDSITHLEWDVVEGWNKARFLRERLDASLYDKPPGPAEPPGPAC